MQRNSLAFGGNYVLWESFQGSLKKANFSYLDFEHSLSKWLDRLKGYIKNPFPTRSKFEDNLY